MIEIYTKDNIQKSKSLKDEPLFFRPIHYLGSKFRIVDFIENTISDVAPTGRVCDLFTGSGTVAYKLSPTRPVSAIDIQEYSKVLCSALLMPASDAHVAESLLWQLRSSDFTKNILWAFEPLISYEKKMLSGEIFDVIGNGAIVSLELLGVSNGSGELSAAIVESLKRAKIKGLVEGSHTLCVRYFGGTYFSYYQAACIDIVLHHIHKTDGVYRNTLLAALLSTVSNVVNTVGKQFAQPLNPFDSNGNPKRQLIKKIEKDRSIDVFEEFEIWMAKYMSIKSSGFKHSVSRMDYLNALDSLPEDTSIVYADPPYTRDHYSRYYHVLETICLRDNPSISTQNTKGSLQLSRGLYRENRHQSPFCIKTQAPAAFENLIAKVKSKNLPLLLSYSPYDETKKAHPRLLTMSQLKTIAKKYYPRVDIVSPGSFSHSKLNNTDKHLEASSQAEIIVVCEI